MPPETRQPSTYDVRDEGRLLATAYLHGRAKCALCTVVLQRTAEGTLVDGVRQHYRAVHPGVLRRAEG